MLSGFLLAPEEQVHSDALRRMDDDCRFAMDVAYSTLKLEY